MGLSNQLAKQVIVEPPTSNFNSNRAYERLHLFDAAGAPISLGGGDRTTPLFFSKYYFNPSGDPATWPLRSDQVGSTYDPGNSGFIVGPDNVFWDAPGLIGLNSSLLTPLYNGNGQTHLESTGVLTVNVHVGTKTVTAEDHFSNIELRVNVYSTDFEETITLRANQANAQSNRTHLGTSLSLSVFIDDIILNKTNGDVIIDPRVYLTDSAGKTRTSNPYIFTALNAYGFFVSAPELV